MRISKFNVEGYHDPTVYEALMNIEKESKEAQKLVPGRYRPLVYICSPYAGDVLNNERKARRYCQFAVRKRAIPVASHLLYPQILNDNDPGDRQLGLFFGTVLLGKCDECWVFGDNITTGIHRQAEHVHHPIPGLHRARCGPGGRERGGCHAGRHTRCAAHRQQPGHGV